MRYHFDITPSVFSLNTVDFILSMSFIKTNINCKLKIVAKLYLKISLCQPLN